MPRAPRIPRARAAPVVQALRKVACVPLAAPGTCACGAPADLPFTPFGAPMGYACERTVRFAMPTVQGAAGTLAGALAGVVAGFVSGPRAAASARSVVHDVTAMLVGGLQTAGAHGMLAQAGRETSVAAAGDPVAQAIREAMASAGWRGGSAAAGDAEEPRVEVDVTPRRQT